MVLCLVEIITMDVDTSASYEKGRETYYDSGAGKTGRLRQEVVLQVVSHDGTQMVYMILTEMCGKEFWHEIECW
jgi:hypothetical protein